MAQVEAAVLLSVGDRWRLVMTPAKWHASGTAVEATLVYRLAIGLPNRRARSEDTSRGGSVVDEGLDQRLVKWLSTQGYPLEMRVARAFEAPRIWADHTRLYVDPAEKVLRELM
jgi:hypothetical protein